MKVQPRIVLAILFAAAIALVTGARHCLRRMTRSDGERDRGNDQRPATGALAA